MTVNDIIENVKSLKPCPYSDDQLCLWLNEAEGQIAVDIHLLGRDDVPVYALPDDEDTEVMAAAPFYRLYGLYVMAMIDFANGEYSKYQNTFRLYNAAVGDYARWYAAKYHPADGAAEDNGYYISAYAIAVKHGYGGSETEWLATLKGDKGDDGRGLEISGIFESAEAIDIASPEVGEACLVGTDLYVWNGSAWENAGNLRGERGQAGATGPRGAQGAAGADGEDGYSPTVSVTGITGGHRVTVTDADGTHTFDVMDGAQGETGPQGVSGVYVGTGSMPAGYNVQIDPSGTGDTILLAEEQSLTNAQKEQARENIGALSSSDLSGYRTAANQDAIDATKADEADLIVTDKILHNVTELLKGHEYGIQNGASPAYAQSVPAGAQTYASLNMVGGHSEVVSGEIASGKCDKVVTYDSDSVQIAEYPVPSAVQSLTGYGWSAGTAYNEIDFENKKYIQRVGVYTFSGTESWQVMSNYARSGVLAGVTPPSADNYNTLSDATSATMWIGSSGRLFVDGIFASSSELQSIFSSGKKLYYQLATPVETDISGYLPSENFIETGAGGTVVFHQQDNTLLQLPNEVSYMVRLEDAI